MVTQNTRVQYSASAWQYRWHLLAAWVVVSIALAGCSANPDYAAVSGLVTLDGKPLSGAGVNFKPQIGAISSDVTDGEGRYQLKTGTIDGALIGDHRVTIAKLELVDRKGAPAKSIEGPPSSRGGLRAIWYTPEKYSDPVTSGLTAAVKPGHNDFSFKLISGIEYSRGN